jgi:hypothetical protein
MRSHVNEFKQSRHYYYDAITNITCPSIAGITIAYSNPLIHSE